MKQIFTLITLFFVASTLQAQTSTNPVYLNYDSNLDWATYISATGSVSNQPSMFFHLPYVGTTGNAVFEWDADDSGTRKTIYRFETSSDRIFEINGWNDGNSSDLWFGDDNNNKFYIADNGDIGIGTLSPQERFHVASGGSMRLDNQGRYFITRSNVTSEMFTATNGQGSGWMINATYGGSGNPQGNSTYSIEPGQHNTSAGYLDFDGNSKNWSFNLSNTSTGIGSSVTWKRVAFFDDSEIELSPTGNGTDFYIQANGNIGIGTDSPGNKLEVNGTIRSKEVVVEATNWPDYVFEEDYDLPTLSEIEAFIKANKHLPEVPSAKEMEANGISLGEMNTLLLKKIEELTLHTIEQQKELEAERVANQKNMQELLARIQKLEEEKKK